MDGQWVSLVVKGQTMGVGGNIHQYIVDNFLLGSDDGLSPTQSLLETGVIDSTGVMELVLFLEETFGIKVDDEDLVPDNLDSVDNIERFVERKRAEDKSGSVQTSEG